jgi:thiosulfate dehydrogenase
MHGKPLPVDGPDLQAMVAYIDWMKGATQAGDKVAGRGVAKIDRNLLPDRAPKSICSNAPSATARMAKASVAPTASSPSRRCGASARSTRRRHGATYTAAGFVKANMVMGHGQKFPLGQGNLSDQDAVDVAEYFTRMPS